MHRLFVALRPPPAIRAMLLDLMEGVPGARWQDDDQLHITLRYIGAVDRRTAEDAAAMLAHVVAPPLTLRISGVGRFDGRQGGRALWAGITPHGGITALHHKLDRALQRAGLPSETRTYLPHVTLARLGGGTGPIDGFLARHAGLTSTPFAATHVTLYDSVLGKDGSTYEAVARWPLSG